MKLIVVAIFALMLVFIVYIDIIERKAEKRRKQKYMDAKQLLAMIRQIRETVITIGAIPADKTLIINLGSLEYSTLSASLQNYLFLGTGTTMTDAEAIHIDGGEIIVNHKQGIKNRMEIEWK